MRHRLITSYGETPYQTILIVKDGAAYGRPADSISWLNHLGTKGGTTALDVVARNPYLSGADVVYHLDNTTAGTTFANLVDKGSAALDLKSGVAVTRAPKR